LQALDRMLQLLKQYKDIISIYTIGHISTPGISDIDMLVVVKEDQKIETNFNQLLSAADRYLFIHHIYGISAGNFQMAERFTFFHNYHLAYGKELRSPPVETDAASKMIMQQTAMEFLVKMYINLFIQKKYKILRMRDLMLHGKALLFDLEFLNIKDTQLNKLVVQIIEWRQIWFEQQPALHHIEDWFEELFTAIEEIIQNPAYTRYFYLPEKKIYQIARNIQLQWSSDKLKTQHNGIIIPSFFSTKDKRFVKMQNKLNNFRFYVPAQLQNIPEIIQQKFQFEKRIALYNKQFLPFMLPLTSSLHLH
jgi:hypothetical protein